MVRPSAAQDLQDVLDYIAEAAGDAVARRFTSTLETQCRKLASLPAILGRARPELGSGLRSFPFRGYIIFFRYVGDVFEVVNILEGHRDVGAFFAHDEKE
jgi:plasmid stabilization system protein ParE